MKKKKKISSFGKKMKEMNGTSKLEVKFSQLLDELNIKYITHYIFKDREYDFFLLEHNILVETHGCFFHCCKEDGFKPEYAFQRKNIKNDQYKSKIVKFDKDYNLLIVWEHEMKDKKVLTEKINNFVGKYSKNLLIEKK